MNDNRTVAELQEVWHMVDNAADEITCRLQPFYRNRIYTDIIHRLNTLLWDIDGMITASQLAADAEEENEAPDDEAYADFTCSGPKPYEHESSERWLEIYERNKWRDESELEEIYKSYCDGLQQGGFCYMSHCQRDSFEEECRKAEEAGMDDGYLAATSSDDLHCHDSERTKHRVKGVDGNYFECSVSCRDCR